MMQEIDLIIKPEFISKYTEGYPLIVKESIVSWDAVKEEGTLLNLLDAKGKFILKAYHGMQNKGYGWVLSTKITETIDSAYFTKKFKSAIAYRKDYYADASTTAFRVFNGEGDGVGGLTIDYFDGFYLLTWYSLGIYEFKAEILEALKQSTERKGIYQKKRFDSKGKYLDEK
ncbi:RlmI/RlmK family 23S rRNA methyltransferase, partial [Sulfurimonas sp. SAG-AH-194-C20]|nr:RlmI/RlmK family 23S rRNA methyltransferase [Sulfurimonas sp. SAG-AH-194-C20]